MKKHFEQHQENPVISKKNYNLKKAYKGNFEQHPEKSSDITKLSNIDKI